jgi:hypothetical protein
VFVNHVLLVDLLVLLLDTGKRAQSTHWIGSQLGPSLGLDDLRIGELLTPTGNRTIGVPTEMSRLPKCICSIIKRVFVGMKYNDKVKEDEMSMACSTHGK